MAENQKNEDSGEKSYYLMDLLKMENELEEESAAVLGGSDAKQCTYNTGYIKRQALYSCLTCCPEIGNDLSKAAGICLACSYKCHENHELVELYTKRNFRCDCPTKRIPGAKCFFVTNEYGSTSKASDDKFELNTSNTYNHNYAGNYCTCNRPYPDPEDPTEDEMIQCVICEDWFHTRHLKCDVIPKFEEYSEMICGDCVGKNDFLKCYLGMAVKTVAIEENGSDTVVDVSSIDETNVLKSSENGNETSKKPDQSINIPGTSTDSAEDEEIPSKKLKLDDSVCKKPQMINEYDGGAIFWLDKWRQSLCKCDNCKKMYAEKKVGFLIDLQDTIETYELKGLKKFDAYYDDAAKEISKLGHAQKIELINGYNHLKEKLVEFFNSHANEDKVITETDVKEFFKKLNSEKRETSNPQYFCR